MPPVLLGSACDLSSSEPSTDLSVLRFLLGALGLPRGRAAALGGRRAIEDLSRHPGPPVSGRLGGCIRRSSSEQQLRLPVAALPRLLYSGSSPGAASMRRPSDARSCACVVLQKQRYFSLALRFGDDIPPSGDSAVSRRRTAAGPRSGIRPRRTLRFKQPSVRPTWPPNRVRDGTRRRGHAPFALI